MTTDYEDLNDSLGAFESSLLPSSSRISLIEPNADVVLLVVEGSTQDATAIALTAELARRLQAKVMVTCAMPPDTIDPDEAIGSAVDALANGPQPIAAQTIPWRGEGAAREILDDITSARAGLVVVPAPYGDDYGICSGVSLGHVVDVLLAQVRVPLLLVRDPLDEPAACFRHVLMPVHVSARACAIAASWAFRLVDAAGVFEVVSVVDGEVRAGSKSTDEALRSHRQELGSLVAAVARHGASVGVDVRVEVEVGRTVERLLEHSASTPTLLCATLPDDRTSVAFHRLHDLVLASKNPVLAVRSTR